MDTKKKSKWLSLILDSKTRWNGVVSMLTRQVRTARGAHVPCRVRARRVH